MMRPITDLFDPLAAPFDRASDALARLDERVRASPVGEAWAVRAHFHDACASLWRQGAFVQVEDLVLYDAGMSARAPTHELVQAGRVLAARRRIARQAPQWALSDAGLDALRGLRRAARQEAQEARAVDDADAGVEGFADDYAEIDALLTRTAPPPAFRRDGSGLVYDPDWDEAALLADWRAEVASTAALPPLLAAAIAFEAWEAIEPLQHRHWLGPLLVAALLRGRGKTRHCLVPIHLGLRQARHRRTAREDRATRLIGFAGAVEAMAATGLKEIERLTLARELLLRRCAGRRANSRLPALVELCLRLPVVSAPLAAKELCVSQQAAADMIAALAPNLRELTERRRYRAWAVI